MRALGLGCHYGCALLAARSLAAASTFGCYPRRAVGRRAGRLPACAQQLGEADAHLELRGRQARQRAAEHRGEVRVPRVRARARVRLGVRI